MECGESDEGEDLVERVSECLNPATFQQGYQGRGSPGLEAWRPSGLSACHGCWPRPIGCPNLVRADSVRL